jgi:diguanylate cyclase (GGDEF)-like protein
LQQGLLNRRGLDYQMQRIGHGSLQGCTLLIVDIDHFEAINDAHGHLLGDKVIVAVANVLRGCIGERGPIARIGGEEFAVLLSHTSSAGGVELAERIRANVERGKIRRADTDESIGNVTVSLALATCGNNEQFEAMIARADRALYQSKTAGRNRVTVDERASGAAASRHCRATDRDISAAFSRRGFLCSDAHRAGPVTNSTRNTIEYRNDWFGTHGLEYGAPSYQGGAWLCGVRPQRRRGQGAGV